VTWFLIVWLAAYPGGYLVGTFTDQDACGDQWEALEVALDGIEPRATVCTTNPAALDETLADILATAQ
jgi:hypothetical protein